jgi:hypothetical protein
VDTFEQNKKSGLIDSEKKTLTNTNASLQEKHETHTNLVLSPNWNWVSELISSLTLSAERQKKTVNPTLKGYGSSRRVEELTSNPS